MNAASFTDKASAFIDSVLRLDFHFAAFDCDGTLWSGDAGERFFDWEMRRGMIPDETVRWARARYQEYLAGKVSEDDMCAEMVTINQGLREADVKTAAAQFFEETIAHQIFPELQELVRRLLDSGCELWAVSSTNEWVIRAAMKYFDIPESNVLAAAVRVENSVVTNEIVQLPSGEGKPRAIRKVVQRDPDAAFGNSRWDVDMLKIARRPFAVNPNPDLEKLAQERGWPVYWPEAVKR